MPEISAAIRLQAVQLERYIDDALQQEANHVVAGTSDYDGGSLDSPHESPVDPAPASDPSGHRPSSKKEADKLRRKRIRAQQRAKYPGIPRPSLSKKHQAVGAISVDFNANDLPAAKGAFVSLRQRCDTSHEPTLDELVGCGFKVVEWDGRCVLGLAST